MSVSARRDQLKEVPFWPQCQPHAGLWFDKYLHEQKGSTLEPFVEHIRQTGEIKEPPIYKDFFNRWRNELEKGGAQMREAQVVGRVIAGLGGETVIETGMTLHRTYGVPYIPGSSLKGAARAYATANLSGVWAEKGTAFRTLFGGLAISDGKKPEDKARVGIAVFCDALPIPGSASWKIHNDVMTVHHTYYYRGDNDNPPADWDSPTPIPFPSVSGRFLIAIQSPEAPEWAVPAMDIVKMALAESGVGGKTSSGYGRFTFTPPPNYHRGTVKEFGLGPNQSFGFIIDAQSQEQIFVHRSGLRPGVNDLKSGDIVDYKIGQGKKGKQAQDVHFA